MLRRMLYRPHYQYLNLQSFLVTGFIVCSTVNAYLSTIQPDANADVKAINNARDARVCMALLANAFLSAFVIKGLYGLSKQSRLPHNQLIELNKADLKKLTNQEEQKGSFSTSIIVAYVAIGAALFSLAGNIILTVITFLNNGSSAPMLTHPAWLLTATTLTNLANDLGFVWLGVLGAHLGVMSAYEQTMIDVAKNQEIANKDKVIDDLNLEIAGLRQRLTDLAPQPIEAAGVALVLGAEEQRAATPNDEDAANHPHAG